MEIKSVIVGSCMGVIIGLFFLLEVTIVMGIGNVASISKEVCDEIQIIEI
jgi:hypothetical protein